jgi:Tol biopolymer transport system component
MHRAIVILTVLVVVLLANDASAQYFGKNKVQYRKHEFRVMQTEHFDIYFHQDRREAVDLAARMAERWFRRFSRFFGQELSSRQAIVLYSSKPDFDQTLIVSGLIDGGTGGVTESSRRRIALPFAPSLADTDHVLGHEIVHAFQFDLQSGGSTPQGHVSGEQLDLWIVEGLAEYLTLGAVETHTAMWLRDAVRHGKLPRLEDLVRPEYFPYRWGHAFWAYVGGRWGDLTVADLYRVAAFTGMPNAIETVLGLTTDEFADQWHQALRNAYPPGASTPMGTHVAGARPLGGSINVGASLSPDGRWVAYLTEQLFSVDLVVADAARGKVVKTLTDTAANPRYSSLQYVGSSVTWDPRGERLAISTLTNGRPALSIFRWPAGTLEKDIVIDGVDEVFGPTWSPAGTTIAFSAMSEGTTDLFVFDLENGSLRRLTDDVYADLQPAWSPDGRRLAFVTDRFTTDLSTLVAGQYRIATIDAETGEIQPVDAFTQGKHIAPQWSRDGRALYFVSDSDGTPDVYAVDLASGTLARMTQSASIAGLTGSSPALSIAADAGTAAVTVYEGGVFAVHVLALSGGAPAAREAVEPPSLPPGGGHPQTRRTGAEEIAVAPPAPAPVEPYRGRLGVEQIAEPTVTAGVDPFGTTAGGGLGLVFSDLLHTRWLLTTVQVGNPIGSNFSLRDVAGSLGYMNQAGRWQWGAVGHVVPTYVGVRTTSGLSGSRALLPFAMVRQVERAARGGASYAFSLARRIELGGWVSQLSFDELSGLFGAGGWRPAAAPMTLASTALAFVSDTSHTGPTSVVRGERYRLEAAPVFGTLSYLQVNADYRRYFMPVPFITIAGRAQHIGRYGSGADDPRIPPLFLGHPSLVRGLEFGWNVVNECVTVLSAECPELNNLLGSRLAVGNLELRVPLLRPFGLSRSMYGPVPVEVAAFVDGGAAWRAADRSRGLSTTPVWSTGVSLRMNVVGLGIGQLDIARPFSRPDEGWVVQLNLAAPF